MFLKLHNWNRLNTTREKTVISYFSYFPELGGGDRRRPRKTPKTAVATDDAQEKITYRPRDNAFPTTTVCP